MKTIIAAAAAHRFQRLVAERMPGTALTRIFRQAEASRIPQAARVIRLGQWPTIPHFKSPQEYCRSVLWTGPAGMFSLKAARGFHRIGYGFDNRFLFFQQFECPFGILALNIDPQDMRLLFALRSRRSEKFARPIGSGHQ